MGNVDKVTNKAQNVKGKAKEAAGRVGGNASTKREGKRDQVKSDLKDAGEKIKDSARH
jgi:uncharacterized protein YjbJ (UPF0337 family)